MALAIKVIHHADHGVRKSDILTAVVLGLPSEAQGFFIVTERTGSAHWCALHGPMCGDPAVTEDQVEYRVRGDRPNPSRMVDRPFRQSAYLTVIGVRDGDDLHIITAYGGKLAPREPLDATIQDNPASLKESQDFWAVHALSSWPNPGRTTVED